MDVLNTLIQYASDLHLEFLNPQRTRFEQILYPVCPILVLAGDICPVEKPIMALFMEYVSTKWQHIICVPGNHEYYNHKPRQSWRKHRISTLTMKDKEMWMDDFTKTYTNVHWLRRSHFDIPLTNIRILGCTLWSHYDPLHEPEIQASMNDFNFICKEELNAVTPGELLKAHKEDRAWLRQALEHCEQIEKRAIVVTHHLPLWDLIEPKYRSSTMNSAYASHLNSFFELPAVHAWFCGHSHCAKVHSYIRKDGTVVPCLMNCRGYEFEKITAYSAFKLHVLTPQRKPAPPVIVRPPMQSRRQTEEDEEIIFI